MAAGTDADGVLARQGAAHLLAGDVDLAPVDHAVRTGEVDELEDAQRLLP
jgi:hypothetical protein